MAGPAGGRPLAPAGAGQRRGTRAGNPAPLRPPGQGGPGAAGGSEGGLRRCARACDPVQALIWAHGLAHPGATRHNLFANRRCFGQAPVKGCRIPRQLPGSPQESTGAAMRFLQCCGAAIYAQGVSCGPVCGPAARASEGWPRRATAATAARACVVESCAHGQQGRARRSPAGTRDRSGHRNARAGRPAPRHAGAPLRRRGRAGRGRAGQAGAGRTRPARQASRDDPWQVARQRPSKGTGWR